MTTCNHLVGYRHGQTDARIVDANEAEKGFEPNTSFAFCPLCGQKFAQQVTRHDLIYIFVESHVAAVIKDNNRRLEFLRGRNWYTPEFAESQIREIEFENKVLGTVLLSFKYAKEKYAE
jgi:hypothetical protein